jgi:hypothetical protein
LVKILKFFDADPGLGWKELGSGINIPDPHHCEKYNSRKARKA